MSKKLPAPPPPPAPAKKRREPVKAIDLSRAASVQKATFRAMMVYIQNPGLTVRQVWENYRLDGDDENSPLIRECVSWTTLQRSASSGKWVAKRDEFWADVQLRVMDEAKSDAVKQELEEIATLTAVEGVLLENITGKTDAAGNVIVAAAKPKSLEGAVNALINLDKHRVSKRDRVVDRVSAAAMDQGDEIETVKPAAPYVEDNLDEDEVRALARQLSAQRAGLLTDEGHDDDGEE